MVKSARLNKSTSDPIYTLADIFGADSKFTKIKIQPSGNLYLGSTDLTDSNGFLVSSAFVTEISGDCRDDLANNLYFLGGGSDLKILAY